MPQHSETTVTDAQEPGSEVAANVANSVGAPADVPTEDVTEQADPTVGGDFAALDSVDFLDDIDFSLEDVESRIAPLALAHL
jgi:hypothetical protein